MKNISRVSLENNNKPQLSSAVCQISSTVSKTILNACMCSVEDEQKSAFLMFWKEPWYRCSGHKIITCYYSTATIMKNTKLIYTYAS